MSSSLFNFWRLLSCSLNLLSCLSNFAKIWFILWLSSVHFGQHIYTLYAQKWKSTHWRDTSAYPSTHSFKNICVSVRSMRISFLICVHNSLYFFFSRLRHSNLAIVWLTSFAFMFMCICVLFILLLSYALSICSS